MKIEDYKRINGWLNVKINPSDDDSIFDFSSYAADGQYHTLSDAKKLYEEYMLSIGI